MTTGTIDQLDGIVEAGITDLQIHKLGPGWRAQVMQIGDNVSRSAWGKGDTPSAALALAVETLGADHARKKEPA